MGDSIDFGDLANFFDNLDKILDKIIISFILDHEDVFVDHNRANLDQAINADGSTLKQSYTEFTKAYKRFKGQPTDRITRKDTGNFYKSIEIIGRPNAVEFLVNPFKVPYYNKPDGLFDRYGGALGMPIDEFILILVNLGFEEYFVDLITGKKTFNNAA